jgi:hypothetical protein
MALSQFQSRGIVRFKRILLLSIDVLYATRRFALFETSPPPPSPTFPRMCGICWELNDDERQNFCPPSCIGPILEIYMIFLVGTHITLLAFFFERGTEENRVLDPAWLQSGPVF